jgi:hypothetical protein
MRLRRKTIRKPYCSIKASWSETKSLTDVLQEKVTVKIPLQSDL